MTSHSDGEQQGVGGDCGALEGSGFPGHRQFLLGEDKSWEGEGGRAGLVEKRRLSQKFPASFCLTFMSEKCHRATLAAKKTGKVNFWASSSWWGKQERKQITGARVGETAQDSLFASQRILLGHPMLPHFGNPCSKGSQGDWKAVSALSLPGGKRRRHVSLNVE